MVYIISEKTVKQILTRELAYKAVKLAFEAVANSSAINFDVAIAKGVNPSDSYTIKSATDSSANITGFKVGTYWPNNVSKKIPAHTATTLLLDTETGNLRAIINASYLNGYRTAAANALATDLLARNNSKVLGVIGAGHQAEHEIRALLEVRDFKEIKVSTRSNSRGEWLLNRLKDLDCSISLTSREIACVDSDVITTVTPAREILVNSEWISPGTHISAMGADAPGKYELDPRLQQMAKLFADLPSQSISLGEFESGYIRGIITATNEITPLGLVSQGIASGRENDQEITIFDSSGLAAQDIVIADTIFNTAEELELLEICNY